MADVDLEVAVTSAGVPAAIENLEKLRQSGKSTGDTLTQLAATSAQAFKNISSGANSIARAATTTDQFDRAITATGKDAVSLTQQLKSINEEYTRLAQIKPGASALQRLTAAGGSGGLQAGLAVASQANLLTETLTANILKDQATVLAQQNELMQARATQSAAQAQLDQARYEQSLSKLSAQARAQETLTRATQEQAAAVRQYNLASTGRSTSGQFLAPLEATQAFTAAIRELTRADEQLANAQRAVTDANTLQNNSAFQSSFSYFIIAGLADRLAQSLQGVASTSIQASATLERSFADVDRTFDGTNVQLDSLRAKLFELSTTTPNSFVDLSQIAALGNQLGIAAADIQSFTQTIAQYSAISGQSAEDAATAFGRISNLTNLPASQYSNLASSIEYVARTSVATESTIATTAKEITALASGAGFSADAIIGLSGALSSLAIPPERARGALSLYFGALNTAVAEGGPKLQAFATLTGKTADELNNLVRTNQGQEVFTSFIKGLSQLDTVAKTSALDTLGLSTIRVDQTMRALAQNVPLVTNSFAGANKAFNDNTELARQYAIIQETLASKITEFQSSVQNAAAALGNEFAPAVTVVLGFLKDLLVNFAAFANSDIGKGVLIYVGILGTLLFVLASAVGALALLKATLTVVPWAISGLAAESASFKIASFVASLFGITVAAPEAAAANAEVTASFEVEAVAATTATTAMRAARYAMIGLGVAGVAAVVIGTLVEAFASAGDAADTAKKKAENYFGTGGVTGLTEALQKDQQTYLQTGDAITLIGTKIKASSTEADGWVAALGDATGAQVELNDNTSTTTNTIEHQTIAYGANAKAALATALANKKSIQDLFKDTASNDALKGVGFDPDAFVKALVGGPDQGKRYVDNLIANLAKEIGVRKSVLTNVLTKNTGIGIASGGNAEEIRALKTNRDLVGSLEVGFGSLSDASGAVNTKLQEGATKAAALNAANAALGVGTTTLSAGFQGETDALQEFQSAISSSLGSFLNLGTILGDVKDKLKLKDVSKETATQLDAGLSEATGKAVKFYNDLVTLSNNGSTAFAQQLATIGPDAQGVLSSALALGPAGQQKIEADARFAAFIASDAFKSAIAADMKTDNDAYATIFSQTGSLQAVQDFIKAQVSGAGVAAEKQWDIDHPSFPLNITPELTDPTPGDLELFSQQLSGQLSVTATVTPVYTPGLGATTGVKTNTFTDNKSGASITLPASLDAAALTASLDYWEKHENSTPQQIEAALNTTGFNNDISVWKATNGPIHIYADVTPRLAPGKVIAGLLGTKIGGATGGEVGRDRMLRFAGGGGWGQFAGGGTGTSDSLLARVSRGEFINTADSTNFWGPSFFDSLNRKMLPASIISMLQAAAVSGNQGPQHTTNVSVIQNYPQTVNPLKMLREDSENLVAGIWG